jgi:hypothetical protein
MDKRILLIFVLSGILLFTKLYKSITTELRCNNASDIDICEEPYQKSLSIFLNLMESMSLVALSSSKYHLWSYSFNPHHAIQTNTLGQWWSTFFEPRHTLTLYFDFLMAH